MLSIPLALFFTTPMDYVWKHAPITWAPPILTAEIIGICNDFLMALEERANIIRKGDNLTIFDSIKEIEIQLGPLAKW